ncbi:ABC transporter permease [Pseudonocardia nematodicida]|uniref:ABC transporter permease n=1 Tax=Pseudonocardia nematodicida TaxID=1206997 RepID=A0ABV1KC33_9PSEU
MNPATRAALAGARRRPRQLLTTGLAVVVATAFAAGTVLFTGTLRVVLTGDPRLAGHAADTVAAVLAGLSVFVGLAVLAAVVVVASTFRIVLGRRSRELALLRCVGASRGQVARSVLAEAALTGLVAGLLGVLVAVAGGWAAILALRASGTELPSLVMSPAGLAGCVLLAVLATVVAALAPAAAAGRVPPVVALGAAETVEARPPRTGRRWAVAGVLTAPAAAIGAAGAVGGDGGVAGIGLTALSGVVLFGALVAAGPFLVAAAASAVRPLVARSGPARLAVANARRTSRRTAATTTVLALGTGLTAALLVGVDGAAADSRASIERSYPADAIVLPAPDAPDREREILAEQLAADLAERPELVVRTDGTELQVDAAPGTEPAAARAAIEQVIPGGAAGAMAGERPDGHVVLWAADARDGIEGFLATARAVGGGLVGTTLLVAVVGVGVTLALSVGERTREIALLRALGLTRAGARRAVVVEAALAGAVGALLGVLLGGAYGVLGLRAMGMAGGVPPAGQLAALAAGVVGVAVLASWAPVRRAGRVEPARGLVAA